MTQFHDLVNGSDLESKDLEYFAEKIQSLSGIALKPTKHDLLKTRVRSRLSDLGLKSYGEYRRYLQGLPNDDKEWETFVNLLTTNKTDFFREPKHFDFITSTLLPQWLRTDEKTFRVWSAASSTGEEAYSIAMLLSRHLPPGRDFKILASDIDTDVIKVGTNAVYPRHRKSEIPPEYHSSCIETGRGEVAEWFRIKPDIKRRVVFKRHNLIEMSAPEAETFDLILCRNVFIYFTPQSIEAVVNKLHHCTKTGGYLLIGHSESLQSIRHDWKMVAPSTLRKGASR